MIEETINFWSMVLPTKYSVLLVLCVQFFFNCKKLSYVTFTQWRYLGGTTKIVLYLNICIKTDNHPLPGTQSKSAWIHLCTCYLFYINCGCHKVKTLSRALDYPYSNKFSLFG